MDLLLDIFDFFYKYALPIELIVIISLIAYIRLKKKNKKTILNKNLLILVIVLQSIYVIMLIYVFVDSVTRPDYSKCPLTYSCECGKGKSLEAEVGTVKSKSEKECSCLYYDKNNKTHGTICPNNNSVDYNIIYNDN